MIRATFASAPRRDLVPVLLLALAGSFAAPAWAQPDDEMDDDFEPGYTTSGPVPAGAAENPRAPAPFDAAPPEPDVPAEPARTGYPLALALRPLTLEAGMSELSSETPLHVSPVRLTERLRVRYGLTDQIELGLRYAPGALTEDGFTAGKAVAVDGQMHVFDWLAVQLSLPILLDPFAMGVVLGAPMKLRIRDKAALLFGRDLVRFRVHGFVPAVEDPLLTAELVRQRRSNTILPRGDLSLIGGAIYQIEPSLALLVEAGVIAQNFGLRDALVPMSASLVYAPSQRLDLGARLGTDDVDQGTSGLSLTLLLAGRL